MMQIAEGTVIDNRFVVRKPIGAGGMGAVFEASQDKIDRTVAIKFLTEPGTSGQELFVRFQQEAQVLSQLTHKNIVRVFAFGQWQAYPYMVMERVHGKSLQDILSRHGAIEPEELLPIILQVLDGLGAAHSAGVIHRDLKPSNILVDENGEVKIIDFGLAKVLDRNTLQRQQLTEAGTALGSVLYMSPEQCRSEPVDARSDLYSLGCLLYHCLTGSPPFFGDHSVIVMAQHTGPDLAPCILDISTGLQAVLDKAMLKTAAQRYQSADEMSADLQKVMKGEAPLAVPVQVRQSHEQTKKPKIGGKILIGASVCAVILGAASLGSVFLNSPQEEAPRLEDLKKDAEVADKIAASKPFQESYQRASMAYSRLVQYDSRNQIEYGEKAKNYACNALNLQHSPEVATAMLIRLAPNIMLGHTDRQTQDIQHIKEQIPDVLRQDGDYKLARVGYDTLLGMCEEGDRDKFRAQQDALLGALLECDRHLHDDSAYNADVKRGRKFGYANP